MSQDYFQNQAQALARAGVKYAFGITGGGPSLSLIRQLQEVGVKYYGVGHEAAAAFMAGACCRNGMVNAVSISIKGPGFANQIPGILSNSYESRPSITISEYYNDTTPSYRMHKRLDHKSLCQSLVNLYTKADGTLKQIKHLVKLSTQEPIGPAHIELGAYVATDNKIISHKVQESQQTDLSILETVFQAISKSEKPVIILGSWAGRINTVNFNDVQIPIVTTASAKGVVNENYDYAGGIVTGEVTALSPESKIIAKADLIIAVGLRNYEVVKVEPFKANLIMIDEVDCGMQNGFEAEISLIGKDVASVIKQVMTQLNKKTWGKELVCKYKATLDEEMKLDDWLPSGVFKSLQSLLDKKTTLVLDTGFFCTIGETVWKAATTEDFCSSSVGRFMGASVPTAIGVAISSQNNNIVCVMGDGGISPYVGEIKLAVDEDLPIVFVLMSDGRYGSIASFADDDVSVRRATSMSQPSWCYAISALGCDAHKVDTYEQLQKIISEWNQHGKGPIFMELPFEQEAYAELAKKLR
jgi:acetolactate synthase I/II/III large subunit